MVTLFTILIVIALVLFFVLNTISSKRLSEINALESEKRTQESKFEFMINQRSELRKEIDDKERELANLKHGQEGIKTYSSYDLNISNESDNDKVSRYLIQEGKITLEQNEKVLKKMELLKMDFLGAALTLGYIDLKTAQQTMKVNKVTTKAVSMDS
jgi:hypothetical protein